MPGSKNLRAVIVKCNKYFGAECADEERLIRDGKALARLIIDDPICGGALPGLGSITILHLLKTKTPYLSCPRAKALAGRRKQADSTTAAPRAA